MLERWLQLGSPFFKFSQIVIPMSHLAKISILIIWGSVISSTTCFAQNFDDCRIKCPCFVKAEKAPYFDLMQQKDFLKTLEEKLKGFTGSIEMRILVDSSGSACCTNIYNNTSTIKSAELREMVNQMTHWKPALQNGYKVVCYTRLYINFSNSKLTVTDGPEIK